MAGFGSFTGFAKIEKDLFGDAQPDNRLPIELGVTHGGDNENNTVYIPETLKEKLRALFRTSQSGAPSFNTHSAIRMMVQWIKNSYSHTLWDGRSVTNHVYPGGIQTVGLPGSLKFGGMDQGRVESGGRALLIKAIYNTQRAADDHINMDLVNERVSDLNNHLWEKKLPVLIEFYRQQFGISPSDEMVRGYSDALCSKAYKTLKQFQAASGLWQDPNLEMFGHFAKLAACGASDQQFREVYRRLTKEEPILDGGTYNDINPDSWRNYGGWVFRGYLDWGDLDAQHLDEIHKPEGGRRYARALWEPLADICIREFGFWKDSPSSSCFSGDSHVLRADGQSIPLREVRAGDELVSHPHNRTVAFVSRPKRGKRDLYELKTHPGIHFTSTHPILKQTDNPSDDVYPALRFVENIRAASMNPTWQSFRTSDFASDQLIIHRASADSAEERLFDIVFEPSDISALPIYYLSSSTGERLSVLSEAPFMEWYPLETFFMAKLIQSVGAAKLSKVLGVVNSTSVSLNALLRNITRQDIDEAFRNPDISRSAPSLENILLTGVDDQTHSQDAADLVEKLIMRLGRAIGREISAGWTIMHTTSSDEAVLVLFVHVLRRVNTSTVKPLSHAWEMSITNGEGHVETHSLEGKVEGHDTLVLHTAVPFNISGTSSHCQINIDDGTGVYWHGGGPLTLGVQTQIGLGSFGDRDLRGHAVIEVELRSVSGSAVGTISVSWHAEEQEQYAAALGYAFGKRLVDAAGAVKMQRQEGEAKASMLSCS